MKSILLTAIILGATLTIYHGDGRADTTYEFLSWESCQAYMDHLFYNGMLAWRTPSDVDSGSAVGLKWGYY